MTFGPVFSLFLYSFVIYMRKKLILLIASLAILVIVFQLPLYNYWLNNNLLSYDVVKEQSEHMSLEERKIIRFGNSYDMYMQIAKILKRQKDKDPIILLPPDSCVRKVAGVKDFHVDEPLVFYYFTGFKAVTVDSRDAARAGWTLLPVKGAPLVVTKITSPAQGKSIIDQYKKFQSH
jgi:hypothetical protein